MGIVHRHKRRTASGKVTTVRQHTRDTGGGPDMNERRPVAEDAAPAIKVNRVPPYRPQGDYDFAQDETWWDDSEPRPEPWMDTGEAPEPELTERERWERDMKADAERRGLPAWRPLGTRASWWRK